MRAMLVLGLNYEQPVVRIQTVSDQQNIPKRFLEQILNDLKSGGFVQSRRGAAGGYRLARRPEQITIASIVRHVEGALAPVSCVSEKFYERCSCPDESRCAIRSAMAWWSLMRPGKRSALKKNRSILAHVSLFRACTFTMIRLSRWQKR